MSQLPLKVTWFKEIFGSFSMENYMRFLAKGDASLAWYVKEKMANVSLPNGTCRIEMKIVSPEGLTFFDATPFKSQSYQQPWIQNNWGNPVLQEIQRLQAEDLAHLQLVHPNLDINNPWPVTSDGSSADQFDPMLAPSAFRPAMQHGGQQSSSSFPQACFPAPAWGGARPGLAAMPAGPAVPRTLPLRPAYPLPRTVPVSPPAPANTPVQIYKERIRSLKRELHVSPPFIDLTKIVDSVPEQNPLLSEMLEKIDDSPPMKKANNSSPASPDEPNAGDEREPGELSPLSLTADNVN